MTVIHVFIFTGICGIIAFIASAIYFHKREKAE